MNFKFPVASKTNLVREVNDTISYNTLCKKNIDCILVLQIRFSQSSDKNVWFVDSKADTNCCILHLVKNYNLFTVVYSYLQLFTVIYSF